MAERRAKDVEAEDKDKASGNPFLGRRMAIKGGRDERAQENAILIFMMSGMENPLRKGGQHRHAGAYNMADNHSSRDEKGGNLIDFAKEFGGHKPVRTIC